MKEDLRDLDGNAAVPAPVRRDPRCRPDPSRGGRLQRGHGLRRQLVSARTPPWPARSTASGPRPRSRGPGDHPPPRAALQGPARPAARPRRAPTAFDRRRTSTGADRRRRRGVGSGRGRRWSRPAAATKGRAGSGRRGHRPAGARAHFHGGADQVAGCPRSCWPTTTSPRPGGGQLLVFTEFADTARWLAGLFGDAGFTTDILEGGRRPPRPRRAAAAVPRRRVPGAGLHRRRRRGHRPAVSAT